jgi:methylenetetrahydrofolate dehydrogenase (NADP+)/methenyltetrahydrofolate cyclohydrolase
LVGKPTFSLLKKRNLNVSCLDSASILKEEKIKEADIIISGIGNGNYINGLKIKQGAILIDAGTSESNSGIIGDVDLKSVNGIASFVSPVPGGVGPVTIAMLFRNILLVAKSFKKNK